MKRLSYHKKQFSQTPFSLTSIWKHKKITYPKDIKRCNIKVKNSIVRPAKGRYLLSRRATVHRTGELENNRVLCAFHISAWGWIREVRGWEGMTVQCPGGETRFLNWTGMGRNVADRTTLAYIDGDLGENTRYLIWVKIGFFYIVRVFLFSVPHKNKSVVNKSLQTFIYS